MRRPYGKYKRIFLHKAIYCVGRGALAFWDFCFGVRYLTLTELSAMKDETENSPCTLCPKEGELARLETRLDSLAQRAGEICDTQLRLVARLDELIPAVARLEVKAGVWGGVGGILAA